MFFKLKIVKNLLLFKFIFLISFLHSCDSVQNDNLNSTEAYARMSYRIKPTDFDYVGIQHNEILDYVKDELKKDVVYYSNDLQAVLSESIYSNITDKYLDSKDLELSKLLINSNIRKIPDYSKGFYSDFSGVSYDLKNYLDKLHALMQLDDDFELSDVLTSIERLENLVYSDANVKNDNLAKFYIATSVAKKSLEYWTNNIDEWDYILNRNQYSKNDSVALKSTKTPGRRIGEIAVADVGGAVGGAVYAWAANVFPGIGQVTYAGAIVGGAVTSSVAVAVYHISASIFRWD